MSTTYGAAKACALRGRGALKGYALLRTAVSVVVLPGPGVLVALRDSAESLIFNRSRAASDQDRVETAKRRRFPGELESRLVGIAARLKTRCAAVATGNAVT